MHSPSRIALAIDPGSSKGGVAVVSQTHAGDTNILHRSVVPNEDLVAAIRELRATHNPDLVVIGSGTGGRILLRQLREEWPSLSILAVDERNTTQMARERYWLHHGRRGWRLLLPSSMQVPPEPVDDFAAVILAERALQRN
ncbi:MAG: pre-16S rRNA-processing nuclease YqgF [Fimbriimonadaceae bacterium]